MLLGLGFSGVLWGAQAFAVEVGLAGILGSKAMLTIDGAAPRTLAVGQSYNGVKLLAVQSDSVQVEIDGKRRSLKIGQNAVGAESSGENARATLMADKLGHFRTTGSINGRPVRFIVDTGASVIGISASEAKRLGLDLSRAETGVSATANGLVEFHAVTLNTVKVGDITLHNVAAGVLPQDMPYALLGMSFLNRTTMERNGDTMILIQRYK
ncbi:MAG: TIGR02281 family clan AA aspartic protease [Zoogloeaceae bacterium]|jgi:aspartyl protease family protein|nr:TIGR02281 family clan AA aspartic protease [Zoogloeaceae bacterium]